MKTRTRNFLLALTIALISLKLFPALDLYALKSLNKLFFDERTFAVITDMGNTFFITAFIIPALIVYSNFNSKINSVSASILVIPSLVFGLFIQLVKNLVNAPRPAGVGDININFLDPKFFFLAIILSLVAQTGDLTISYLKRIEKIKDTGKILPGHGGIFDRIDGLMFVVILGFVLSNFNIVS